MIRTDDDIVATIAEIFTRRGAEAYLGEAVTVAEHMLQCGTLAQQAGAPDAVVAAALLHDIGHFTSEFGTYSPDDTIDRHHEAAGAALLARHFPPQVGAIVGLHVAAKRYLCAVEQTYHAALSKASQHSLDLQGGPMTADEVASFEHLPHYRDAVLVRRWDDAGKVAGLPTMTFDDFRPLLARVINPA